jgi:glycosyltransferase involved in cell wall biosynthesis
MMSVRDGERWLAGAVESILAQTFRDLELIVVDDGSTDGSAALLARYADPRLRVIRQGPSGLTVSLNRGFRLAHGSLLARLDADDRAVPERLARQVAYLEAHPEVGLLGTGAVEVSPEGETLGTYIPPLADADIRRTLIRRNPLVHSSVMMRREAWERAGGYDEALAVAQDYDLWLRMSRLTRLANLPEPLVLRRLRPDRVSLSRDRERLRSEARVRWRAIRSGAYPPWCAVFLAKPLLGLALPGPLRRRLRALRSAD